MSGSNSSTDLSAGDFGASATVAPGSWIEIYGTKGSLSCPDPNTFGGEVFIRLSGDKDWSPVPLSHVYSENWRSIGVADMAYGLQSGRKHRANGQMAYHVVDVMQSFLDSGEKGRHVTLASTCERPAALPTGLVEGKLDR